jgi:hypothetical protein
MRFVDISFIDGHLLDLKMGDDINPSLSYDVLKNTVKKIVLRYNSSCEDVGDMDVPLYTDFI